MKRCETVKFNIERNEGPDGFNQDYEVDVELDVSTETSYGADADGHRGIRRSFIDAWEIVEIRNGGGALVEITEELRARTTREVDDLVLD